jgi:hypothetical protein
MNLFRLLKNYNMRVPATCILCVLALPVFSKTSAVLDSSATRIEVKANGKMQVAEFKRWKILDEDGYRHCVFRDYKNSFRSVKTLHYTIYNSAGRRVRKLGLSDALDILFNAPYEVTDSRMLLLDPGYRSFPFVVEVETSVVYDQFLDFPDWMPRYSHGMEVNFASLVLQCPADYRLRYKSFNMEYDSSVSYSGDRKSYTWTLSNLPTSREYINYRTFAREQARVILSPLAFTMGGVKGSFSSWSDFGDWYLALNKAPYTLSDLTRREIQKIRERSAGDRDLVRNIYKYMQQKTRYISIQLGIGGFKALPVGDVDTNGYGDCKALTHYMQALLAEVGIASNYVLVGAGKDVPDVIAEFPSNQFNHIFLAVPHMTDTTWLECTSQVVPASYLGTFTDDRNVLWISHGKSSVIRSPRFSASQSMCKTRSVVTLDVNGNAEITVDRVLGGFYFDESIAYSAMSATEQEHFNQSKFLWPDFSIKAFKYSTLPLEHLLAVEYKLKVNSLATRAADRLLLPLHLFGTADREVDVDLLNQRAEIRRAFTHHDVIEMVLPEGFHYDTLPEGKYLSTNFGTVEIFYSERKGKGYVVNRKVTLNKGFYGGEEFLKFNKFLETIRNFDQTRIAITIKT